MIRVVLYTENAGPNIFQMKLITMLEKLSVSSEKLSFSREQCMLRIVRITPAETYDPADFRVTLSNYDTEQSILCLKKLLDEIEDPRLYSLCCAVFGIGTARYERFLESPLTEEATHSYFGGFLKHTINVANLADIALTICEGSPNEVIRAGSITGHCRCASSRKRRAFPAHTRRCERHPHGTGPPFGFFHGCGFNGRLHKQPVRTGETGYGYVRTFAYPGSCQWNDTT